MVAIDYKHRAQQYSSTSTYFYFQVLIFLFQYSTINILIQYVQYLIEVHKQNQMNHFICSSWTPSLPRETLPLRHSLQIWPCQEVASPPCL
jgi:hypothetical protein